MEAENTIQLQQHHKTMGAHLLQGKCPRERVSTTTEQEQYSTVVVAVTLLPNITTNNITKNTTNRYYKVGRIS
jgi:hypothetical protein